jgi:hypothetical protein
MGGGRGVQQRRLARRWEKGGVVTDKDGGGEEMLTGPFQS